MFIALDEIRRLKEKSPVLIKLGFNKPPREAEESVEATIFVLPSERSTTRRRNFRQIARFVGLLGLLLRRRPMHSQSTTLRDQGEPCRAPLRLRVSVCGRAAPGLLACDRWTRRRCTALRTRAPSTRGAAALDDRTTCRRAKHQRHEHRPHHVRCEAEAAPLTLMAVFHKKTASIARPNYHACIRYTTRESGRVSALADSLLSTPRARVATDDVLQACWRDLEGQLRHVRISNEPPEFRTTLPGCSHDPSTSTSRSCIGIYSGM